MTRKAVIDTITNIVTNVVELDNDTTWPVPENHILVDSEVASPDDSWDGAEFTTPTREPTKEELLRIEWDTASTVAAKLLVLAKKVGFELSS